MSTITLTIDNQTVEANEGMTVLEAAIKSGIYIPTLCYHPMLSVENTCRVCLVQIEGISDTVTACSTKANDGMVVTTDSPRIASERKESLKKVLAEHPCGCLVCERRDRCSPYDVCLRNVAVNQRCVLCPQNEQCELQQVTDYVGLEAEDFQWKYRNLPVDTENPLYERDYNLCIGCNRCVKTCKELRGIEAIKLVDHDGSKWPEPSDGKALISSGCKYCCACVESCPTGALIDKKAKYNPKVNREEITNPCSYACPSHIDVPRYVRLCGEGKFTEALSVIREKVPFPGVLGRVCIHPCEQACKRQFLNEPISIKSLKLAAAERGESTWKQYAKKLSSTGKKVAVVGAGPAGLTAGYYLAKQGHAVTIFEALSAAGGMMKFGIPDYRLPAKKLEAEVNEIKAAGVDIKLNTKIESFDELFQKGYDAVFVAPGAHKGLKLGVKGEETRGVIDGATFLREVKLGKASVGEKVAVVGGGNVAIDAARTALRLGATKVCIVYRRTRAEMPARPEEIEGALEEGIELMFLAAPVQINPDGGKLRMTCVKMELGEPDASGRRRPVPIKGSEFPTDYDTIIAAIGQMPDIPTGFNLKVDRGNIIKANPDTLATNVPKVWAGGDAVSGPASVIEAIAGGRKAASEIDKYLGGTGDIEEILEPKQQFNPCVGKEEGYFYWERAKMPALKPEQSTRSFVEVELGFDDAAALKEGRRCLQCAMRKQMKPPPLPPKKSKSKFFKRKAVAPPVMSHA